MVPPQGHGAHLQCYPPGEIRGEEGIMEMLSCFGKDRTGHGGNYCVSSAEHDLTNFDAIPRNHFAAIYADPPWSFECWSGKGKARSADNHYDTMQTGDIATLPVNELAGENCALFMWACWPTMEDAFALIRAWGFTYKTCAFTWLKADPYRLFADDKTPFCGMGYWTRANSEVCLLATRGKPKRLKADVRQGIISPRREHSRKPDEIYGRIERLVSGPYLELFARTARPNWTSWGNQVGKFTEAA